MAITIYYANDADPGLLSSRTIAVLGYGTQGQAHAQNLRDAGHHVLVAQRPGGPNHDLAIDHAFEPLSIPEAVGKADLLILALPDESMGDIYDQEVAPNLKKGQALGFVHGFAIRFGLITPPPDVDVIMIAPKGPGSLVRERFQQGGGITCILAVHQDATGLAKRIALAWGLGIGGGKGGMIEATFAAECEADLFGEQTVLCGGVLELMKAAYDILVDAGFPEEIAYFECVHEVKQVVDLQYAAGLAAMREAISNTAAYGGLTRGPRLVTEQTRREMRAILAEVRTGRFAKEWIEECRAGRPRLKSLVEAESKHPAESAGDRVRTLAERSLPK
jgi:ketol-acid reductoisomerase